MKRIYRIMAAAIAAAFIFVVPTSADAAPRVPGNGPVVTDRVTDEELYVIASWENGPLLTGARTVDELQYPLEVNAQDCTDRGCTNGCTIGYGYNLGAHSVSDVVRDFEAAGMTRERALEFARFSSITGIEAVALCGRDAPNRHLLPTMTADESWELLRVMAASHKQNVVNRARAEGLLPYFNSGQFAIMVALDYQNPVLSSEATYVWRQLRAGDTSAVLRNIRNHMGTRFAPGLQTRRNWEASYFAWATRRQRAAGQFNWPGTRAS